MTYQSYLVQMRRFSKTPISEADFNKMQGIDTEQCEPCFLSRNYTGVKNAEPTIKQHEKRVKL